MPIKKYEEHAIKDEHKFFNNPKISKANKEAIKDFLMGWKVKRGKRRGQAVSPATRSILFKHITKLMLKIDNIKIDMHNKDKINKAFDELEKELGINYLATVINKSLAVVTKLNDGVKPKGFKDIQNLSRDAQRRDLSPDDMISWEDGLKLVSKCHSLQWKTIILTQLDGGFRPSEFVDLNYGDVTQMKDFIRVKVKDGKTGKRNVYLFKCVPYLLKYLKLHPTRKADDPLWITEYTNKSHKKDKTQKEIIRYDYDSIRGRLKDICKRANFNKPYDFYNFRHSACTLAKEENIPLDEAAAKFGHSIKFFTDTYGRLSETQRIARLSKSYGIEEEKKKTELNATCRCGYVNPPKSDVCEQCGNPLNLKKAMELDQDKSKEMAELKDQMTHINKVLQALTNQNKIKEAAK